jgi:hypothetical protein
MERNIDMDTLLDKLFIERMAEAARQARLLGVTEDMSCWDELTAALARRELAVKCLAKHKPFTLDWDALSERIVKCDATILSLTGVV